MLNEEKRLKKQILLIITIVIVLIAGSRLYIDILHNKEVFDSRVKTTINQIQTFVSLEQKRVHDFYSFRAKYLLNNKNIIEAMKNRDREKLYKLVVNNYKILKNENRFFSLMHFHLPNGNSFLRMHSPAKYGDNLLDLRPMIRAVHEEYKPTEGFEVGKMFHNHEALQYRIACPIFDADGIYLGALEFGVDSSQIVSATLEILNYTHEEDRNKIQITFLHSSDNLYHQKGEHHLYKIGPYNLAKHSDFFEYVLEEELDFLKNSHTIKKDSRTYLLQWNQVFLNNYDGKREGTVLISFDITNDEEIYYNSLIKSILAPIIVLIIMLLFFNWGFNYFMKKLMKSHNDLELQHKFTQSLLDLQDNIIITTNGLHILSCNTAFLKFFNVEKLDDFKKSHDCICNFFLNKDGFFSLEQLEDDENWIDHMVNEPQEDKNVVSMLYHQYVEPRAFSVKVNKLEMKNHHYVITFTDITDISIKSKEFEYRASHDSLTRVYNRMKLNELFKHEISLAKRYKDSLSIIMLDIDHFKAVNDKYGHLVGDDVLVSLSEYISESLRESDIFARWGGEEFMIVLPHTSLEEAKLLAEKLCSSIFNELSFKELEHISCSFGVTDFKEDDTQDEIFKRVDDALYKAKERGRNCVVAI